jgi:predicted RNA-binding protein with PUA domain
MIQIKQAVQSGNFNLAELNELNAFVNSVKVLNAKSSISVGDKVYVVQKTKKTLGVVEKVKVKNAIVTLPNGRYNVPLSMLEVA